MNVALSLVLSAFRNSGDLRLRCYWGWQVWDYLFIVSLVCLGKAGWCFRACWGLAGVPMPVISRVVFLGIFEPHFLWLVVCRFRSFGYDGRFCLNVLLVVLLSIFELIG